MKKSLLAATLGLAALLSACASQTAETTQAPASDSASAAAEDTSSPAEGIKIGVSVADQSNVFYIDILDGMESAMQDGDELVVMDAGFDAAKQLSDVEDMIQQGVKAMLIDPVDSNGIKSAIDSCNAAGIPVIAYNSPVDQEVASTVESDNYMAGQLIGEALGEALNGEGKVAMLTYNVAKVTLARAQGFEDAISQYDGIEIVEKQEIQPGVDTALPVAENILQSYPDLVGMFALNDPSAIGCVAAVESSGMLDQVKIVGVDGSEDGKKAIAEGKMLASAAQHPIDIGKESIETAYAVIAGESVEKEIKVPVELIDKNNAGN